MQLLKRLVEEYSELESGVLIENHTELIEFFAISGSKHDNHPHMSTPVSISRRALKHFVEQRTEQLGKNHTQKEALENMHFAIEHTEETICHFDLYEFKPPVDHFYTKDYSHIGKPSLRILLEFKNDQLEVKSIHFRKNKKKTKIPSSEDDMFV
jgi:hypothetical protein